MSGGLIALAARLERKRGLLGLVKLANVGLGLIWGFVITFVFVRLLPLAEFRAFLLLFAFANYTISAELGFSAIIYSRLRRRTVAGEGDFRSEEVGVLMLFMVAIIAVGAVLIGAALASGLIPTQRPLLFLVFYLATALNLVALLAKRALAGLDHNLWWEAIDFVRRLLSVALPLAALFGLPLLDAMLLHFTATLITIGIGLTTIHRTLAMPLRHWWALRSGGAHVRRHYLADIGRTAALTLSDITAYNLPYFSIVAATHDPRPLLLFDFIFKISRGLSAIIRALVETALPGLTRHFIGGESAAFRLQLRRCILSSLGMTAALCLLLLIGGAQVAHLLFNGKLAIQLSEIIWLCVLLVGLAWICVSVYLQVALGRYAAMLMPSFAFLLGSLLSVPLGIWIGQASGLGFALAFAAVYALVHAGIALVHALMLSRLGRTA